MINFLTILSVFIWPFGQLLNIQLSVSPFILYPLDVCVFLLTILLLATPKGRHFLRTDPLTKPLLIFLSLAVLSLIINIKMVMAGEIGFSLFYLLRLFVYPSVYFCIKYYLPNKYLKSAIISLVIFSFIGLAQYLFFPDMRFLKSLGFDDHYFRLIGSLYDPNFTGAILAGAALILLATSHWWGAIPLIVLLALTFSRASYLVFSIGLLYLLVSQRKKLPIFFLLLLASVIYLTPKPFGEGVNLFRTYSLFSRLESWQSGWNLFVQRPIFGWGYNTLRSVSGERYQIDNSYFFLAATTGILGIISFLNLLRQAWKQISTSSYRYFILTILLHSFYNNSFFYIWINFAVWVALGLSAREYKES